jgi:uncharacterized membrane protein YgaE (UPF0421/DUF939 family)
MFSDALKDSLKLSFSMTIFYAIALTLNWDMPKYGALAIILISLGTVGASLQKGMLRIAGTTVGLLVGFVIIANFYQTRWLAMSAIAVYLFVISYMMQRSRYNYAWYVAGFVPIIIWAVTYNKFDLVFHYAIFRYLETTVGVVIYTLVCAILWPKNLGNSVYEMGKKLLKDQAYAVSGILNHLAKPHFNPYYASSNQLSKDVMQFEQSLKQAFVDSIEIVAKKRQWIHFLQLEKALIRNLVLWQHAFFEYVNELVSPPSTQFKHAIVILSKRFDMMESLVVSKDGDKICLNDNTLLNEIKISSHMHGDMNLLEKSQWSNCIYQFKILDSISIQLLKLLLDLLDIKSEKKSKKLSIPIDSHENKPIWDKRVFKRSFFPPFTFIIAFLFWVCFDPPSGPEIPMMSAVFGLTILNTPISPFKLLALLLPIVLLIVGPIYFIVMPLLSGMEILILIFIYTLVFSLLGSRYRLLKTLPILLFVMITNINNDQSYAFNTITYTTIMLSVALLAAGLVYMLFVYRTPENKFYHLLRSYMSSSKHAIDYILQKNVTLNKHYYLLMPQLAMEFSALKVPFLANENTVINIVDDIKGNIQGITLWIQIIGNLKSSMPQTLAQIPSKEQRSILSLIKSVQHIFDRESLSIEGRDELRKMIKISLSQLEEKHVIISDNLAKASVSYDVIEATYVLLGAIIGLLKTLKSLDDCLLSLEHARLSLDNPLLHDS